MRVIKSSGVVKDLYFVSSQSDLGDKIIYPKIPDNFLTRGKFEEWQTPRIRLYPSVEDCLSGLWLGEKLTGSRLYVYRAKGVRNESLIKPSITSVPYALVLDEYWYLGKLRFEYLGEIEVGNEIEKKLYHYGPRSTKAYIYRWAWKEIGLKPWETSKINNKDMKLVKKTFSKTEEEKKSAIKDSLGIAGAGAVTGAIAGNTLGNYISNKKIAKLIDKAKRADAKAVNKNVEIIEKLSKKSSKAKLAETAKELLKKQANNAKATENLTRRALKAAGKATTRKTLIGAGVGAGIGAGVGLYKLARKNKDKK